MNIGSLIKMVDVKCLDCFVQSMKTEGDWIVYVIEDYSGKKTISVTNKHTFCMCVNLLESCAVEKKDKIIGYNSFDSKEKADAFKEKMLDG